METDIETGYELINGKWACDHRQCRRRGAFDDCLGGVGYLNRKCQTNLTSLDDPGHSFSQEKKECRGKNKNNNNNKIIIIIKTAYSDEWLVRQRLEKLHHYIMHF